MTLEDLLKLLGYGSPDTAPAWVRPRRRCCEKLLRRMAKLQDEGTHTAESGGQTWVYARALCLNKADMEVADELVRQGVWQMIWQGTVPVKLYRQVKSVYLEDATKRARKPTKEV